jgi:hypothetical protein
VIGQRPADDSLKISETPCRAARSCFSAISDAGDGFAPQDVDAPSSAQRSRREVQRVAHGDPLSRLAPLAGDLYLPEDAAGKNDEIGRRRPAGWLR